MRSAEQPDYLLRSAVRHVRDGILITDADLSGDGPTIVFANAAMTHLTGYDRDEIVGSTPRMFQGPETDRAELDRIRAALERREPVRAELVNYAKNGRPYRVEIDIAPLAESGAPEHFVAVQRDITDRTSGERHVEHSQMFHRRLAELVREALDHQIDASYLQRVLQQAVEVVPNAQAGSLTLLGEDDRAYYVAVEGYDEDLLDVSFPAEYILADFPGRTAVVKPGFTPPPDMDPHTRRILYGEVGRAGEIRASLGVPLWVEGRLRGLMTLDNFDTVDAFAETSVAMALLYGRLLERADQQIDVSRRLRTDPVTGLPARGYGEAILARRFEEIDGRSGAFLLLDLDDFKSINDAYGHRVGDRVMREVGRRATETIGRRGTVTRWTGDEFMIVLPDIAPDLDLATLASDVLHAIERPVRLEAAEVSVTGSLGVVHVPEHASDASEAIQHALIAVHHAKRLHKRAFVIYRPEMRDLVARRTQVERDLRSAIVDDAIHLHYQPRFELATGRVVAVEALARWTHPELGTIPPSEFISVAEETGLIHELGERVLIAACEQARAWMDAGRSARVAVNVSAKELQCNEFIVLLRHVLDRFGLPPSRLELEITESTAMTDVRTTIDILHELRRLGVAVSIDDFGTAYSSLSYLRELPVDALKIDRSFVMSLSDRVATDPHESALVRGIVALGQSLGLRVVAEGVETAAQLAFLEDVGCEEAQGYFLAAPGPADELPFEDPPIET